MIGANLVDLKHEVKGKVDEIVMSRDGAIAHAIVRVGAVLGVGGSQVAVPLQAIRAEQVEVDQSTAAETKESSSWLHVEADLPRAPKLETPAHLELTDAAWLQKNFAFFRTKLPSQWAAKISSAQADSMVGIDMIIGGEVFGQGGESLSYLDDLILKLNGNPSAPYAVLGHGGLLGVGKEYVAVDLSKLQIASTKDGLHITTALDSNGLAAQQRVTPDAYPELRLQSVRQRVDE